MSETFTAERVIAFRPEIARQLRSIEAAIFYQQMYFWSDKGGRVDGFVYKSAKEIEDETCLTEKQQRLARKKLVDMGWLETKKLKANGAPTHHYKCLMEMHTVLAKSQLEMAKGQMDTAERPNGTSKKASSITEITTEITHKTTTYSEQDISLVDTLYKLIKENNPLEKRKPTSKEYNLMRLMRERDQYPASLIEAVIYWSQTDSFWCSNILSVSKLRAQFPRLALQAKVKLDDAASRTVVIR